MIVRQGVASGTVAAGVPRATLDLSGLGTFVANARGISVGVESSPIRRAGGVLYLARTNLISVSGVPAVGTTSGGSPALYIGHNTQSGNQNSNGSAIYLGITNAIFGDYFVTGRGNQTNNLLAFNPGFLSSNPVAYFRSIDGIDRVGVWTIGDNSAAGSINSPSSGTNDFTGGKVDALVDLMFVGRGAQNNSSTSPGVGTLTFNNGTINVNTLYLGYQNLGTNLTSSGIGTVNVISTNAMLIVNSSLELGRATNTTVVTPSGTLNIREGRVLASNIIAGGTATITITNGTLAVTNTAGTPSAPLTALSLTNSTLQFSIANANTNSVVTTLTTGGSTNRINIASLPAITSYPTQFTLLKYSGAIGGAGFNFGLASLPAGSPAYQASVSNNTAKSAVVLIINAPTKLVIVSVNGGSAPVAGTPFGVVVQSQDNTGAACNATVDTAVSLSLNTGTGTLGGTLNGLISAGSHTITITNVTYTKAENGVVLTVSRTSGDNLTPGNSSPFTVNPGVVSAAQSTVLASPASVAANGASSSTITVTLKDAYNNPVAGKTVTLAKNGGSSTISAASGPSNAGGIVTFSVTDLVAESTVYTATDTTDSLVITQTASVTFTSIPWHNAAWSFRKAIVIDHTKVAAELTNFPVLINLTDGDLPDRALANGFDMLFTSFDGTNKLAHQIEYYSSSNGALIAWVNVPNLSSTTDTVLYLYYGNPAAANQQNATAVWTSNFRAVWHLEESGNGTAGEYKDASSNTNHAQGGGGLAGAVPARGTGKIGSAQSCDGANDYIVSGNNIGVSGGALRTLSFWVNLNTTNRAGIVGWGANAPDAEFEAGVRSGNLLLWAFGSGNDWSPVAPAQTNSWRYHAITYDGTIARWYVDGAQVGSFTNNYATTNGQVFIGYENDSGLSSYLSATIDEVRVAGSTRSAGWIATEYNNQNSPGTFYLLGSPERLPASRLAIVSVNGGVPPVAGTSFSVVVEARDTNGFSASTISNTAISLGLNTGGGTLGGTLTGTIPAGSNSVVIAGVTYTRAENGVVLSATRTSGDNLASTNSVPFTVTVGSFAKLQLLIPGETATPGLDPGKTGTPTAQTVGVAFNITANAVDANWNLINTNDTVHFTSSDTGAVLPLDAPLSGGTGVFSVTFQNAGSQTVTVSDVTHPAITSGTSAPVTVNAGNQTITYPSPGNQTYGVAPITLNATASSGLTVSYSVLSGPASVSGNSLTITGAGSVTIRAEQAGNANWNAAPSTNQTISVAPRTVTGSITVNDKVYDGTAAATIASRSLSGVINGDVVNLTGGTAGFADKHSGSNKTVIATGLNLTGAQATNYTLASASATNTAGITPATLTVDATGVNRAYNGTTNATVTLSDNRVAGDVLTPNYTAASFPDKNVGNNKPVQVSGIFISGADSGNYTANTTANTTANITPAVLTATAIGVNRIYDGTTNATVTFSDDRFAGDVLTVNYASAGFANKNVGNDKAVSVTGISLSGPDAGNYTVNTTAATTAHITPRTLVVSATGVNKVYDGTTNATVTLSDNRISGDVLNTSYGTAAFTDKNVGVGKTVHVSDISVTGADSGNYAINTTATTTANITPASLAVTAAGVNRIYDGTTNATVTLSDNRVASDVLTANYAAAWFADRNVGNNKPVTVSGISISGADSGNYLANTNTSTTADITPAALTVSADDKSRPYGAANPLLTASYSGFVGGEDTNVLSGSPDLSTTATPASSLGTYPIDITAGTLGAPNYSLSFVGGTLTVLECPVLTITLYSDGGTNEVVIDALGTAPNAIYHILYSTNLVDWTDIGTAQTDPDGSFQCNHYTPGLKGFYRLFRP